MPQSPTASDAPSVDIDIDQKYVVELVEWTEGLSQSPTAKPGEMSLTWKFRLTNHATGEQLLDLNTNEIYELWQWTNTKTYKEEAKGLVAKAREWAEALLGKAISNDGIEALNEAGWAEALVGRKGLADIEWYTTKKGSRRLRIYRLRPFKKGAPAAAAPIAEVAADPMPQASAIPPVASDTARRAKLRAELGLDDDDDEEVAA